MTSELKNQANLVTPVWIRKRAKKTQRQIAVELGTTESVVSKWERGVTVPHPALIDIPMYCRAYECSVEELIEAFSNIHSRQQTLQVVGLTEH
jgi:transcriptional regulator with XRE-family HTH domain